ncbi:MAG TPA: hypothetical protein VNN21_09525 [Dehalococcoidia bacterium]|nr:hypothetical protein [Dehalococcoidia bacterium]
MKTFGLIALGLAAVAVGAFLIGRPGGRALAQTPGDPNADARHERYLQYLAEELNVSVDELKAAQKAARNRLIDEAVQSGKLTPEMAEKLKNAEPGSLRGALGSRIKTAVLSVFQEAAKILGLTPDQVREGLRTGKSLNDMAEEQGVDDFEAKLEAALTDKIRQAVANGDISQAMADRLQQALSEHIDELANRSFQPGEKPGLPFFKRGVPQFGGAR